jgi:hypothetical protein
MACHHFLHYNAMLSGGAFLGSCLKQMGKPRAVYQFSLPIDPKKGKAMLGHEYVRDYMARLDTLELSRERREAMVLSLFF